MDESSPLLSPSARQTEHAEPRANSGNKSSSPLITLESSHATSESWTEPSATSALADTEVLSHCINIQSTGATENVPRSGEREDTGSKYVNAADRREVLDACGGEVQVDSAVVHVSTRTEVTSVAASEPVDLSVTDVIHSLGSFSVMVAPVALTLGLASWVAVNIQENGQLFLVSAADTGGGGQRAKSSFERSWEEVARQGEDSGESIFTKLEGALIDAGFIIGFFAVATFVIVACYKFNCMKALVGYMFFSCSVLLIMMGGHLVQCALDQSSILVDKITLAFLMCNFGFVGVIAIFYQKGCPIKITQGYLVCISVIMAWQLSHLPEWTTWTLLLSLSVYDLCAVLTPCGPLRILVNLVQSEGRPLPGLLYEADVTPAHVYLERETRIEERVYSVTPSPCEEQSGKTSFANWQNTVKETTSLLKTQQCGGDSTRQKTGYGSVRVDGDREREMTAEEEEERHERDGEGASEQQQKLTQPQQERKIKAKLKGSKKNSTFESESRPESTGARVNRMKQAHRDLGSDTNDKVAVRHGDEQATNCRGQDELRARTDTEIEIKIVDDSSKSKFVSRKRVSSMKSTKRIRTGEMSKEPCSSEGLLSSSPAGSEPNHERSECETDSYAKSNEGNGGNDSWKSKYSEKEVEPRDEADEQEPDEEEFEKRYGERRRKMTEKRQQSVSQLVRELREDDDSPESVRTKLRIFYREFNPELLYRVSLIEKSYRGRYHQLWQDLGKKYGRDSLVSIQLRRSTVDEEELVTMEGHSIKLGLGDFVFYSVLVSRAALLGFAAMISCSVTVLLGLGATLFLLSFYRQALPALPISIFAGAVVYGWFYAGALDFVHLVQQRQLYT